MSIIKSTPTKTASTDTGSKPLIQSARSRRVPIAPDEGSPIATPNPFSPVTHSSSSAPEQMPHSYAIGYRKPPARTRFAKGKSGNPKGRPRHVKNLKTILEEEVSAIVSYSENGKMTKASKTQLAIKSAINKAVKGDLRALLFITKLMEKLSPQFLSSGHDENKAAAALSASDIEVLAAFGLGPASQEEPKNNSSAPPDTGDVKL